MIQPSSTDVFSTSSPLGQLIEMGGPVMVVLIIMAVIGAMAFIYLMLQGALFAPRNTRQIKEAVNDWQHGPRQSIADKLRKETNLYRRLNPLHHLVLMAMDGAGKQPQQVREAVSQEAQQALMPFDAPLKLMEVIAALAPLLGLLGTVIGMMDAFSSMAAADGRASASQLSGGIYLALTTTAAGLIVAIPFAALAAWIEFRLRRLQTLINRVLTGVFTVPETPALEEPQTRSPAVHEQDSVEGAVEGEKANRQEQRAVNAVY